MDMFQKRKMRQEKKREVKKMNNNYGKQIEW